MRKRDWLVDLSACALGLVVGLGLLASMGLYPAPESPAPEVVPADAESWVNGPDALLIPAQTGPDYDIPDESEAIEEAVMATLGTENERTAFGYNATYVLRVLTAEAGYDEEVAHGVAQCLFNTCVKLNNTVTPEDVCHLYQYAEPLSWYSETAAEALRDVLLGGRMYAPVEDATVFYNPSYGWSSYHESCEFITEINGVRFFREVD